MSLPGGVTALRDASGLSYLANDLLGTPILTDTLGTASVTGTQLRAPYGQARFAAQATTGTAGGMHTTFGFTGQREDSSANLAGGSGLDYFNARSYDAVVGRFTAADSMQGADPLGDAYAYVGGLVETATDPSGHSLCGGCEGGGSALLGAAGVAGGPDNIGTPRARRCSVGSSAAWIS